MKITEMFSYAFLGALSCTVCLPSEGSAMKKTTTISVTEEWGPPLHTAPHKLSAKELIRDTYRIQLFSLSKTEGKPKAHARLEEMRSQAPSIAHYAALIASEKDSKWIRGQIGPFRSHDEAITMQTALRKIFTKDLPTVSAPGIVHQSGFEVEESEEHIWH